MLLFGTSRSLRCPTEQQQREAALMLPKPLPSLYRHTGGELFDLILVSWSFISTLLAVLCMLNALYVGPHALVINEHERPQQNMTIWRLLPTTSYTKFCLLSAAVFQFRDFLACISEHGHSVTPLNCIICVNHIWITNL